MHRHRWEEARRAYTPGQPITKLDARDTESTLLVVRLLEGVTTVELRCRICGDIRERTLSGKVLRTDGPVRPSGVETGRTRESDELSHPDALGLQDRAGPLPHNDGTASDD